MNLVGPLSVRILGCGTSGGVPRVGGDWGACDPENPKNRRRRVSILVKWAGRQFLVDTSPDLREQLLDADVRHLDAVLLTHDHADHTHGIDDLRGLYYAMKQRVPVHADPRTAHIILQRFKYVFEGVEEYPAIADLHLIKGPLVIAGLPIMPFAQIHGPVTSLGFRFGSIAYSTDLNGIPPESEKLLYDLDLWIVDALRYTPHPTHTHLERTLEWIGKFKPKRAILTHMNQDMDYDRLKAQLPNSVEPAYDGMEIMLA